MKTFYTGREEEVLEEKIERVDITVLSDEGVMEEGMFEELPIAMLVQTMSIYYGFGDKLGIEDVDAEEIINRAKAEDFHPASFITTDHTFVGFMRVKTTKRLNSFGLGRFSDKDSEHAQRVIKAMSAIPDVSDLPPEYQQRLVDTLTSGAGRDIRERARDSIQRRIDEGEDLCVPLVLCHSEHSGPVGPTDIASAFGAATKLDWDKITPLDMSLFQEAFTFFINLLVYKLNKPVKIQVYGDHNWLSPDSNLAKELRTKNKVTVNVTGDSQEVVNG